MGEPRDPRAELEAAGVWVTRDPSTLGHDRTDPMQRALGCTGVTRELGEVADAAAFERIEDIEHGGDPGGGSRRPVGRSVSRARRGADRRRKGWGGQVAARGPRVLDGAQLSSSLIHRRNTGFGMDQDTGFSHSPRAESS